MSVHTTSSGDTRLVGYVSTHPGDTDDAVHQVARLVLAGCATIHVDSVRSGGVELVRALKGLQPGQTLVVTRLDRLGRSTGLLLELLDRLRVAGNEVRALDDGVDSATDATFTLVTALRESAVAVGKAATRQRFGPTRPDRYDDERDPVHLFAALTVADELRP